MPQARSRATPASYGLDFFDTDLRGARLRRAERGRRLRRLPHPLPALAVRHGVRAALQGRTPTACSKIYEMVINNDPCYAYLLRVQHGLVDQKLVMAHVYGHCDFFKNNFWFRHTNRKMMDEMANHATRVRRLHRPLRRGDGRGLHRRLPVPRGPDRLPLAVHQAPRRPAAATGEPEERGGRPAGSSPTASTCGSSSTRRPSWRRSRSGWTSEAASSASSSRSGPSATCCSSCWSTRRWSAGSATSSRSSATRPTTSPRRARPRS